MDAVPNSGRFAIDSQVGTRDALPNIQLFSNLKKKKKKPPKRQDRIGCKQLLLEFPIENSFSKSSWLDHPANDNLFMDSPMGRFLTEPSHEHGLPFVRPEMGGTNLQQTCKEDLKLKEGTGKITANPDGNGTQDEQKTGSGWHRTYQNFEEDIMQMGAGLMNAY